MSDSKRLETVAVLNSSDDTVEMLRLALQAAGFTSVVTGHIDDFKRGQDDFLLYLQEHDPKVLIYDVSIPYLENWQFLRLLLDLDSMRARRVVVTTTNKRRLEEFVGPTDAIEIVGKPYDIGLIVDVVIKAVGG